MVIPMNLIMPVIYVTEGLEELLLLQRENGR